MKVFALCDCNAFYVSCEQVFNPQLQGKPVVVLSNNDGCVVARSQAAKAIGIKMGVPAFQIRSLIQQHQVQVYSSNYALYGDLSRRVMTVLAQFTPDLEIYSIDEAFLGLSIIADLIPYCQDIRRTVQRWTGIPVSIGIGPSKVLAKLANHLAKRSGKTEGILSLLNAPDLDQSLAAVEIEAVWGIGRRWSRFLRDHGITTALQLRDLNENWVKQHLGIVGVRLVLELRGISCLPLELAPRPKRSITVSRSFGSPVTSIQSLREAIATYASRAAQKLRRERLVTEVLTVFIITSRHSSSSRYYNAATAEFLSATNNTAAILPEALRLLQDIYRPGLKYQKAGIIYSHLSSEDWTQGNLFEFRNGRGSGLASEPRYLRLMQVMDQINRQWGADTLRFAICGLDQSWKRRSHYQSPCYTTRWTDLPIVRA